MPGTPLPKSDQRLALEELQRTMKAALKNVDVAFTQFVICDEDLPDEDWAQIDSQVVEIAAKLQDLHTATGRGLPDHT